MRHPMLVVGIFLASFGRLPAAEPWARHAIDNTSRGADGVRLADFNGDGWPDVATGWEEGGLIRIYAHPGPDQVRRPWPKVTVGQVPSPEDAILVDLDADGRWDVVSSCEGKSRTVFFHWAPGQLTEWNAETAWRTVAVPATQGQQMWMFAVSADVDGRHGIDLLIGSKGANGTISWLEAPAQPRAAEQWRLHRLRDAGWIMSLVLNDMDGDGDSDVVFSDRKGNRRGVSWLENPGPAAVRRGAAWTEHPVGGTEHEVMFLSLADWNGDGVTEIVAAVSGGPCLVFEQVGSARSWRTHSIPLPAGCGTGKAVAMGDLDGDGQLDLVFTCENATQGRSGVRWLSRRGATAEDGWVDHEISGAAGVKFDRVELLDLDRDGDLDVLTCEERDNLGVIWYENQVPVSLRDTKAARPTPRSAARVCRDGTRNHERHEPHESEFPIRVVRLVRG